MNQFPAWKYALIVLVLSLGCLYALPNLYPEQPAIQVSGASASVEVNEATAQRAQKALVDAGIDASEVEWVGGSALIRVSDLDEQREGRKLVGSLLGNNFVVAMNLAPTTPEWLANLGGSPLNQGLDLRGGVHFLLEVDLDKALEARQKALLNDIKKTLRAELVDGMRFKSVRALAPHGMEILFASEDERAAGRALINKNYQQFAVKGFERDALFGMTLKWTDAALREVQNYAIEQNQGTIRNRVNAIGVAEPLVQRQGVNRIVVQLPGVQDTAVAKRILGRTATLDFRLVDPDNSGPVSSYTRAPAGTELHRFKSDGRYYLLKKRTIVSGDSVIDANMGFDQQSGQPQVSITLDSKAGKRMQRVTQDNLNMPMAILFVETKTTMVDVVQEDGSIIQKPKPEEERYIINVANIRGVFSSRFQISGLDSPAEAQELALLLRSGALAAPMHFVEERTVGPSLGKANIEKGLNSVLAGFLAVLAFMFVKYRMFGLIANIALAANLVIIVALMSLIGATLTLPGIAGIVLTVGMAVDANVLIFARIREELAKGLTPHQAIDEGYGRAFWTIFDANVTTLIVAIILYAAGSGSVKGFAVTLFLGILTSMFTAIMGTRGMVNLVYGSRSLKTLKI